MTIEKKGLTNNKVEQEWVLKAKILGNFILNSKEVIQSSTPPHPSIKCLVIDPELDTEGNQTGIFQIDLTFSLSLDDQHSTMSIADHGRYLLNFYLGFLASLTGQYVDLVEQPALFYQYPETNKTRFITFPSEQANISPPVKLNMSSILSYQIDENLWKVMYLIFQGLKQKDIVASYILLFSALELLANQFKIEKPVIDKCEKCGYEKSSRPGSKKCIEVLLVEILGYPQEQFTELWKARNDISHGGFDLKVENRRTLYFKRSKLHIAIINGLKEKWHLDGYDFPVNMPPVEDFLDPIFDITYHVPN